MKIRNKAGEWLCRGFASNNLRPDEPLSDDRLRTITCEYLRHLGYGDQHFIVFKHWDIAREHIHLVSTRVRHDGSKIRDTMEHVRSTRIMRSLEAKFGLMPSGSFRKKEGVSARPSAADIDAGGIKLQVDAAVQLRTGAVRISVCRGDESAAYALPYDGRGGQNGAEG